MSSTKVCPNVLSQGACTSEGCAFRHDVHLCQTCRVVCLSNHLKTHLNGKRHARRVRAQACPYPSFCTVCKVALGSPSNYPQHVRGRAHQALLEKQGSQDESSDTGSLFEVIPRGHLECHVCDLDVPEQLWSSHVTSSNHRKKERFVSIQAAFDEADKDKHGVTVSSECDAECSLDFGLIELDSLKSQPIRSTRVTLHLTTPGIIEISEVRLSSTMMARPRSSKCVNISKIRIASDASPSFSLENITLPMRLWFQKPITFTVTFDPHGFPGRSNDRLEIVFLDTTLQTQFVITRSLVAVVGSKADWELTKPSSPYKPKKRTKREPEKEVTSGIKPPQLADIKWVVDLPQALVPHDLEVLLEGPRMKDVVDTLKQTWLPGAFNSETYGRHFKILLHVEETQMK